MIQLLSEMHNVNKYKCKYHLSKNCCRYFYVSLISIQQYCVCVSGVFHHKLTNKKENSAFHTKSGPYVFEFEYFMFKL